jgi:hypothetical protein
MLHFIPTSSTVLLKPGLYSYYPFIPHDGLNSVETVKIGKRVN